MGISFYVKWLIDWSDWRCEILLASTQYSGFCVKTTQIMVDCSFYIDYVTLADMIKINIKSVLIKFYYLSNKIKDIV